VYVRLEFPFSAPYCEPGAAVHGCSVTRGVVPFSTQFSRPRSGEAESIQDHSLHALSACSRVAISALVEGCVRGPHRIRVADRGRGGCSAMGIKLCAGADSRAGTLTRRLGTAALLGCEGHNKHCGEPRLGSGSAGSPPTGRTFPYFWRPDSGGGAPPRSRRGDSSPQRSFCVSASPLTGSVSPAPGLRSSGRQESRLAAARASRQALGRRASTLAAASMAASKAASRSLRERRGSRASRHQRERAGR